VPLRNDMFTYSDRLRNQRHVQGTRQNDQKIWRGVCLLELVNSHILETFQHHVILNCSNLESMDFKTITTQLASLGYQFSEQSLRQLLQFFDENLRQVLYFKKINNIGSGGLEINEYVGLRIFLEYSKEMFERKSKKSNFIGFEDLVDLLQHFQIPLTPSQSNELQKFSSEFYLPQFFSILFEHKVSNVQRPSSNRYHVNALVIERVHPITLQRTNSEGFLVSPYSAQFTMTTYPKLFLSSGKLSKPNEELKIRPLRAKLAGD
jgi:hypothetical protein